MSKKMMELETLKILSSIKAMRKLAKMVSQLFQNFGYEPKTRSNLGSFYSRKMLEPQ